MAVEKLASREPAEIRSRQDALQMICWGRLDIFYPPICTGLLRFRVLQQPRLLSTIDRSDRKRSCVRLRHQPLPGSQDSAAVGSMTRLTSEDAVGREAPLHRMLANGYFVWSDVDAVNFVACHVAVQPLNLRSQMLEDAAGFL